MLYMYIHCIILWTDTLLSPCYSIPGFFFFLFPIILSNIAHYSVIKQDIHCIEKKVSL